MNSDQDSLLQSDTPQPKPAYSFKPPKIPILFVIILLVALVGGTGWYILAIRISQSAPKNTQQVSSQPLPTRTERAKLDTINCINDANRKYLSLSKCTLISRSERRSCVEKKWGEFFTLRAEVKKKLDACYYKYPSYFPKDYQTGENVTSDFNAFDLYLEIERPVDENGLSAACIIVNGFIGKYRHEFDEYPRSLSDLIPKYMSELPRNVVYERQAPDKFAYTLTLSTDKEFPLTQKDVFEDYDSPSLKARCREWAIQHSSQ